ncbi:MAG: barstar family protein [Lachnospiraceae bacterium]|nr:barstar family protein [Lachnospiraceae bacterium]
MKKIILNLNPCTSREEVQDYLMEALAFPTWYGHNLDALYDCLTEIARPTAIGIFQIEDTDFDLLPYKKKVLRVFFDAEDENDNLAVIYGISD